MISPIQIADENRPFGRLAGAIPITPVGSGFYAALVSIYPRAAQVFPFSALGRPLCAVVAALGGWGRFGSFIQFPFEGCSSVAGTEQHKGKFNSWKLQPENRVSAKCLM